jgi:hypothetical protein
MSDPVALKIESLGGWRAALLARIREAINAADPAIVEDIKWRKATNPLGVPTWSLDGIICTGESYKDKVKVTFMNGRALDDVDRLFNVPADGVRRAIDLRESDAIDLAALTVLVRQAIATNRGAAGRG